MEIPADKLSQQKMEFNKLKEKIVNELGFQGLNDEEIEDALRMLINVETEAFNNSMNDLVLRKYYNYFIDYILPEIYIMISSRQTPKDHIQYYEYKQKINEKNKKAIMSSLNAYFYSVNNGFLVNTVNSHEAHLADELEGILMKDDIFRIDYNYNSDIATKYPAIDFDYNLENWVLYASYIQDRLFEIENNLNDKVPSFKQTLAMYEQHIKLYKDYIRKYRFIMATDQIDKIEVTR